MKKTQKIGKVKQQAWEAFSKYIRLRDAMRTIGNNRQCKCITCDNIKNIYGVGCIQAGHFIPGRKNAVLFDEDQVNGQCFVCNYRLKGNWVVYEHVMVARYGQERVQQMKKQSKRIVKYTVQDLLEIKDKYEKKVLELGGFPSNK